MAGPNRHTGYLFVVIVGWEQADPAGIDRLPKSKWKPRNACYSGISLSMIISTLHIPTPFWTSKPHLIGGSQLSRLRHYGTMNPSGFEPTM